MLGNNPLKQYQQVGNQSAVEDANPYRLVQMLMEGALDRLAKARGHMERKEYAKKGENISSAVSIIGGLQGSLDLKAGGSLAENLESLYEYMAKRLLESSYHNDVNMLDEVVILMNDIKSGWDGIQEEADKIYSKSREAESNAH